MEASTKELRIQPGRILEQVAVGQEVTITYRGKPLAKLIPWEAPEIEDSEQSIFGLWKNHDTAYSVEEEVRSLRRGRRFDN